MNLKAPEEVVEDPEEDEGVVGLAEAEEDAMDGDLVVEVVDQAEVLGVAKFWVFLAKQYFIVTIICFNILQNFYVPSVVHALEQPLVPEVPVDISDIAM